MSDSKATIETRAAAVPQTIEIAGIQIPILHQEPGWLPDTQLILTSTTRRNLQKILYPLREGQNILLVGDAGVGKNALLYYINRLRRHPTLRYSFNEDTLPEDLVGAYRIDPVTRGFVWSDGPLARAMRKGMTFVADEMNLCPPEVLKRFSSVFTDRSLQLLEGDASLIKAAPGFNFVATQNPAEGFEGRKNLPREIQKYFVTIFIDSYPEAELEEILSGLYPACNPLLIRLCVRINHAVEGLVLERKLGQRDLERYHFNIRNLSRLLFRIGKNPKLAAPEIQDIYLRPFRSREDLKRLSETLQKILADESWDALPGISETRHFAWTNLQNKDIEIHIDSEGRIDIGRARLSSVPLSQAIPKEKTGKAPKKPAAHEAPKRPLSNSHEKSVFYTNSELPFPERVARALDFLPPVESLRPVLGAVARGIEHSENMLLECESNVEPEEIVEFFSILLGKPLSVISLSRGMHTSDVLGGLKPRISADKSQSAVEWVDGPLTQAVRRGDWILLKGLEAAGPELVEKLNMLLDDARALMLPPESGETDPIELAPDARIFAIKYFRKQRSTPSISRAFRNRFSAIVVFPIEDRASLLELASAHLGIPPEAANSKNATKPTEKHSSRPSSPPLPAQNTQGPTHPPSPVRLAEIITDFHIFIKERARKRDIGAENLQAYEYGLTNLRRACKGIAKNIEELNKENAEGILLRNIGISYINEIALPEERQRMLEALRRLYADLPLDALLKSYQSALKKKSLKKGSAHDKKIWWDQKKHWRNPNTGKFKPKLTGRALKEGIEINTPETGGETKEGPDAWYGSDTKGNLGQGEPGHGGGAWGYRTEELYREFLKKRRPLWDYQMGVSLEEFKDIFEPEIERVVINFDRLLDPQVDISRRYLAQGSRVDVRRYLSYLSGRGDGRVFDKTTVEIDDDKLKGVEILFAVNKGRRIFNFDYAVATLVSIMSCSMILKNHELSFGVAGYSDLDNKKDNIDIQWFKTLERDFDAQAERDLFAGLVNDWHGDTVVEHHVLESLAEDFSPDARTRILVVISDFRGYRSKRTIQKDIESFETGQLRASIEALSKRGFILLGVGLGPRAIADVLFYEALQVGHENYAKLPALLSSKVTELVHKHHNAVAL